MFEDVDDGTGGATSFGVPLYMASATNALWAARLLRGELDR